MDADVDVAPQRTVEAGGRAGRSGRGRRARRPIDRSLLVASFAIAAGLVLVAFGLTVGITGDDAVDLPDAIESVSPVPDAVQVLSQSNVVVDLQTGYEGVLVVDGLELETIDLGELDQAVEIEPGRQVDLPPVTVYEPGNATLTFTPTEGAPIEEFSSGLHRVQVIYWRIEEGRQRASSYSWVFNVV